MSQDDVRESTSAPATYAWDEITARAAAVRAHSAQLASVTNRTAARPVWQYNHVIAYGQSLSSGWEGWPALSVRPRHNSLMIGASVNGTNESGAAWLPAGPAVFRPLVATVMTKAPNGEVLGAEEVAALAPGTIALGETILEGALDFWRGRQLALRATRGGDGFAGSFVASSCGVGGRSIEQLSPGAVPPLFDRPRMAAALGKQLADSAGGSYGVAALLLLHGENNSVGTTGSDDRGEFVRQTAALQAAFNRDIVAGIAGQDSSPAVFTHQVSGLYVRDANAMSIPMAQLDCAYSLPNWFLVGPSYPVTEKGGHLDPNGYRWLGQQFGKVMHKVLDLDEGWKPLHPLRASWRGTQVLIEFHVPHPPLVFSPCYVRTKATSWADGGFSVTDDDGRISVTAAAVVADTSVLLVLERAPGANPHVWYGDQTSHGGYGNLRDSDPTLASAVYEFREGSGQYPGANIPELIGKPYPLWNWCVVFRAALQPDPAPLAAAAPEPVPEPTPGPTLEPAPEPAPEPASEQKPVAVAPEIAEEAPPQVVAPAAEEQPVAAAPEPDPALPLATNLTPEAPAAPPETPTPLPPATASEGTAPGGVLNWLRRLLGRRYTNRPSL